MALSFTPTIANDNSIITLTDTSTTWGTTLPALDTLTDVVAGNTLYAHVKVTTTAATYQCDVINLSRHMVDTDGLLVAPPPLTQAAMVFKITPDMLTVSTVPVFSDTFGDGIYEVEYVISPYDTPGTKSYFSTTSFLVYGDVKNELYSQARQLDLNYLSQDENVWQTYQSRKTANILQQEAFIFSLESSAYVAREIDLIQILSTLENIQVHGANTYWK